MSGFQHIPELLLLSAEVLLYLKKLRLLLGGVAAEESLVRPLDLLRQVSLLLDIVLQLLLINVGQPSLRDRRHIVRGRGGRWSLCRRRDWRRQGGFQAWGRGQRSLRVASCLVRVVLNILLRPVARRRGVLGRRRGVGRWTLRSQTWRLQVGRETCILHWSFDAVCGVLGRHCVVCVVWCEEWKVRDGGRSWAIILCFLILFMFLFLLS